MDWSSVKELSIGGKKIVQIKRQNTIIWKCVPPKYQYITPTDTDKFPSTLTGFKTQAIGTNAWTTSSKYIGSFYTKTYGLTFYAKKLGRAYSNFGNYATSFNNYTFGDIAIGYSSDPNYTQAVNIWAFDHKPSNSEMTAFFTQWNIVILAELYESDGSVWKAVKNNETNTYGYLNESTNEYVVVANMTGTIV